MVREIGNSVKRQRGNTFTCGSFEYNSVFRVAPPYPVACVIDLDRLCCASFRLTLAVAHLFALDWPC